MQSSSFEISGRTSNMLLLYVLRFRINESVEFLPASAPAILALCDLLLYRERRVECLTFRSFIPLCVLGLHLNTPLS